MILTSIEEAPLFPVSHDPQLKKRVLVGKGAIPHIRAISFIEMNPGDTAESHSHAGGHEVFFGLGGRIDFVVEGRDVPLAEGACLVVEPGEVHSIKGAARGSRMLYFLTA
ncbi:MAG: cupin domain-containing protein [Nitrospirota bacterium]|jgi:quercetin dioxygenase-like cupin family protein